MSLINFNEEIYKIKKNSNKISFEVNRNNLSIEIGKLTKEVVEKYRFEISNIKDKKMKKSVLKNHILNLIDEKNLISYNLTKEELVKMILDEIFGYSFLQKYIDDPTVNDIMVNSFDNIWIRKGLDDFKIEETFKDEKTYQDFILKICANIGEKINEVCPKVEGKDSEYNLRITIFSQPLSINSSSLIIRKDHLSVDYSKVLSEDLYPQEILKTIDLMQYAGSRVIISGPMESGKTTLLNTYINRKPLKKERMVIMCDTDEIVSENENTIYLKTIESNSPDKQNISLSDLVRYFKRTNGTMPIVPEVRGQESVELLDVFNAGFKQGITSIHANSPLDTIRQLIFQIKASNKLGTDRAELEEYLSRTIDFIIYMEKRKIVSISEVVYDYDLKKLNINTIHKFNITKETISTIDGEYQVCVNPFSSNMIDRIRRVGMLDDIPKGLMS